jgi:hypothetical protein
MYVFVPSVFGENIPAAEFGMIPAETACSDKQLDFLKSLLGLGTEEEEGYRTGPPGYIGWRNSFLGRNRLRGPIHV